MNADEAEAKWEARVQRMLDEHGLNSARRPAPAKHFDAAIAQALPTTDACLRLPEEQFLAARAQRAQQRAVGSLGATFAATATPQPAGFVHWGGVLGGLWP